MLAPQLDMFSNIPLTGKPKMAANLSAILDKPATDFNFPPPLSAGGYHCVVQGLPEQIESSKKKTQGFEFLLTPVAYDEDVDEAELQAIGGLEGKVIKHTMWLSQDESKLPTTVAMLREFLEHCGISPEGKSVNQMIDEVPNAECMVFMRHEPIEGRDAMRAVVAKTGPVPKG